MPKAFKCDWVSLKADWETDEFTHRQLGEKYGVSHVRISQRAKQEGWIKANAVGNPHESREEPLNGKAWKPLVSQTSTAERLRNPKIPADKRIAKLGNRSEVNMQRILKLIAAGANQGTAAYSVGIDPPALSKWKASDPEFAAAIQAAEGKRLSGEEQEIRKAGKRGDWRASLTVLERHRLTRQDWAPAQGSHGPTIQVNLGWTRDQDPTTIDITPKPQDDQG